MQKEANVDNFKVIYKILKILEKSMGLEEFDKSQISAEALGLEMPYWPRIMTLLLNEGYISGIYSASYLSSSYPQIKLIQPEITLKGLEYLNENSFMKKAANIAKGVIDIVT